jgi:SAM-dependent methyltransferase
MTRSPEGARRRAPRLWDTDWLMLRGLGRALARQLDESVDGNDVVLDFGCGTMPYRLLVENRGATYVGADFDGSGGVSIGSDGSLPVASGTVDTILSVQVLEHVRDLDRYLGEAARVLKGDGTLLLSTHGNWLFHPHPEDHRRWTRTGLAVDIEARGFRVESTESIVGPLATTTMIRLTGYAFFLRRVPLFGRLAAGALAVIMNLRGWLEDRLTPPTIRHDNGCVYVVRCTKAPA